MSIIEKLGIGYEESKATITCNSPLAKKLIGDFNESHIPVENKAMLNCKRAAPALFEALYPFVNTHSHADFINEGHCDCMGCTGRRALEKATGKSWEEIKALL